MKTSVTHLNKLLAGELTSIHQYYLHAKLYQHWGYNKLHDLTKAESLDEMKHADEYAERILYLDGTPCFDPAFKIKPGTDVKSCLESDLALEVTGIQNLKSAIVDMEKEKDYGSRDLLQKILADEEKHKDYLETQLGEVW